MCHGGYSYKYDGIGPVWKITDDGKHIIFYGKYQNCPTSTKWCKEHCYMKTKPTKKDINPKYDLNTFKLANIKKNKELHNDLSNAKYVTIFASGCLGGIQNFYNVDVEDIIFQVSHDMIDKKIMFFIRHKLDFIKHDLVKPDNAVIVVSVDKDTSMELINWAIDSDIVSSISIIDHEDNSRVIKMLKAVLDIIRTCSSCKDFDCFGNDKGIILCEYQHRLL